MRQPDSGVADGLALARERDPFGDFTAPPRNVMAIKVELAERDHIHAKQGKTGISVMLSFARFVDRVRPQASLAIALAFKADASLAAPTAPPYLFDHGPEHAY
jgi:hypothetical protein